MHLFPRRRAWLALILVPLAATTPGQQAIEGEFADRLEVHEVLLDVVVTDPDGALVLGLGREDFVVEDGGEPVEIVAVSFYGNKQLPVSRLAEQPPIELDPTLPPDRFFALLFDQPAIASLDAARNRISLRRAGKASLEWIDTELLATDHLAVLGFDGGLRLYHDFTTDRTRLARAVERAATGKAPDERWVSRTELPQLGITLAGLAEQPDLRKRTREPHQALAVLAEQLGTVRGRKNIIVFASDFLSESGPGPRQREYRQAVEALNDHNVAVYTLRVDGRGRVYELERLADDTGGRHLFHYHDLVVPLGRISTENSGYYLLSYRAELRAGDSGYRDVSVRTTRPGLEVRTRSGYRRGS